MFRSLRTYGNPGDYGKRSQRGPHLHLSIVSQRGSRLQANHSWRWLLLTSFGKCLLLDCYADPLTSIMTLNKNTDLESKNKILSPYLPVSFQVSLNQMIKGSTQCDCQIMSILRRRSEQKWPSFLFYDGLPKNIRCLPLSLAN